MKRKLKTVIIILILIFVSFLGYSIKQKVSKKNTISERIQNIPNFTLKTLNKTPFTTNNLAADKPKLIIYFNSECEFCQSEASQIQNNLKKLNDIQLVFISYESSEKIKSFAKQYKLSDKNNVIFLEDEKLFLTGFLDIKKYPYMLLYSENNTLIKEFKGVTKVDSIVKLLE